MSENNPAGTSTNNPPPGEVEPPLPDGPTSSRLDVWLWCVRQLRSRSAATSACKAGHVKLNGESAKASAKVKVGDEVRLRVFGFDRVLIVKHLLSKRVGAPIAQRCYQDVTPARITTWQHLPIARREPGTGRPTKRERRQLDALRGRNPQSGRR